ncbi:hypothetical protein [Kineococcus terrestris]|uniref:hypothetical protein n=1 Tax=Kineococcus terrestris TaxID=2044856 RepID=UPI0034DAD1CB
MQTQGPTTSTSRRPRRRLATFTIAGVAALSLGLGACSAQDGAGTSAPSATSSAATERTAFEVVRASAQQGQEAGSARFALSTTTTATGEATGGQEQTFDVSGEGSFDAEDGAVQMSLTLPAMTGAAGSTVELRLVDEVAYLSGAPLTGEGQWVRLPLDALGGAGLDTGAVDPSAQLQQLRAVADDVTEVPGVEVRGVQTRGYSGTIDPQAAFEALPPEQQTEEARQALTESGLTAIPFTLYVDEQDRPARIVQEVDVQGVSSSVTMDFWDWGSDVEVEAPEAGSVVDAPGFPGAGAEAPAGAPAGA